jgi:hypothetical protein
MLITMRSTFLIVLSLFIITLGIITATASGPVFWRINTRAEVEKGDARGVSIADNGTMTLAPSLVEVFDTKQAYIWSTVADNAGNIYLGTGNEGRIYKVDSSGKGTLLYKTTELSVMALAVDDQGNLYAGTSPDGKVYRIAPGGEAKVFFEPKTKYIWSLAFDGRGRLLVGTGDKGTIYRVNADGAGAPLVKTTQSNITALRVDSAGNVIAGTDPGGLVLRISPDGRAFTLFDSSLKEVRDLAVGKDGDIYALTLAESAGGGAANSTPGTTAPTINSPISADEGITITISDVQTVDAGMGSSPSASPSISANQPKSALYKIDAGGAGDALWDSRETIAFAITVDTNGEVLVGTGQKGRIYSIKPAQNPLLLTQSSEDQTARFVRIGSQVYAAASNLGKLFRLSSESGVNGTYTSSVRDAQSTANWGRISWVGEGAIDLQTRSGNTTNPDSTWSDWSEAVTNSEGNAIKSPPARYIQWRATLKRGAPGSSPRLREVTISYLPRNLAPKITSLNVLPIGVTLQPALMGQPQGDFNSDSQSADAGSAGNVMQIPPRRGFQRGAVSLDWQGEDRNGDGIEYSVFYRNAVGGEFYPLKTGLRETYYTVEPNALPDGRYVFKVIATDIISNPADLALTGERETEAVEIDNTPPSVTADAPKITSNQVEVILRVADTTSIIRRAEYQVDGGDWRAIFPVDGIADSKREEFRVTMRVSDAKPHLLAFRAFDSSANIGNAQATIKPR